MSEFKARNIKSSFIQVFIAPPSKVFPLLCPVREYDWIEPWHCEMLHSASGVAEKNCIFRTQGPGEASHDVWVISHYEPTSMVDFVRTNAIRVMTLSIALVDNGDGTTKALNEQLLVGLTPEGNEALPQMAADFTFEMRMGEAMLNHFLTTGTMLPLKEAIAIASKAM